MFTKLLKHDFLQSGRLFIWQIFGCAAVGALVTLLSSAKNIGAAQFGVAMLLNLLLALIAWAAQLIGMIIVLVSTNRAFFSERGYLLFSLPASSEQVLLSKLLCNMAWLVLNSLVSGGLLFVMMRNFSNLAHNISDEMLEQLPPESAEQFKQGISGLIYFPSLGAVIKFVALMLVYLLVVYVLVMMAAIFVLTVSHVRPFANKAGLWVFLFMIITGVGSGLFIGLGTKLLPEVQPFQLTLFSVEGSVNATAAPNLTTGILMLALTAALFCLTNWLLKRKISLK
ncbi:MAG: hypothetical protein LBS96_00305 [Oscillospiraceae bacterium]|jgi:hypothetical protein|nr:hypothetical protein [Oscillospiraceae bacterium]